MGRRRRKNNNEQPQQRTSNMPLTNQQNNKNEKPSTLSFIKKRQIRREKNKIVGMAKKKQINLQNDFLKDLVNQNLINCEEGQELKLLSQLLQPNSEGLYNAYICIHNDLVNIVSQKCNNFQIHPFGSTINGLAFKDSDFDLYVDIGNKMVTNESLIYSMASIMRRYGCFSNIVAIAKARVPIVKCVHIRTGFNCDIGFTNPLGTYNSRNLHHIINFDRRIHPLAIILKYWLRTHRLSGHGKITHYCLIMMIIFYLQIIPQPILPPIIDFQANIPEVIVEHWNVAFNRQLPNNTRNTQGVCELLNGFFQFYSDFNYAENIICPLYGRTFSRKIFESNNVPVEFKKYKEYLQNVNGAKGLSIKTPFCIQDPFNLAYNMATCTRGTYNKILKEIENASKTCQLLASANEKSSTILYKLFNSFAQNEKQTNEKKPTEKQPKSNIINASHKFTIKPSEADLSIIRMVLSREASSGIKKPIEVTNVQEIWAKKTIEFVGKSLVRFFLFSIEVIIDPTNRQQKDDNNIKIQYELTAKYDTYIHRKFREHTNNYIELEEAESINRAVNNVAPTDLTCVIEITAAAPFDQITIEFRDPKTKHGKGLFKSMANTFSTVIPRHIKAFYLEYQTKTMKTSIVEETTTDVATG